MWCTVKTRSKWKNLIVAGDTGIARDITSFDIRQRRIESLTRSCLTGGDRLKEKKVFQPVPTSYPVSGFPYKEGNSPEPISGDCLKRAELKTKQNNNDTPYFVLDNHNVNVAHYVPTPVPSTMSSEWEISMYDAHELFSCIQTDSEEVIRGCVFALPTLRIEVWALLIYS
jgi:hypothetical protein